MARLIGHDYDLPESSYVGEVVIQNFE